MKIDINKSKGTTNLYWIVRIIYISELQYIDHLCIIMILGNDSA